MHTPDPDPSGEPPPAAAADGGEALPALFQALYEDLRRIARRRLRAGGAPITLLDTNALVHEVYERLVRVRALQLEDSSHFLAYAARAMRSIVVDAARGRAAQRRGGGVAELSLTEGMAAELPQHDPLRDLDVLRVHEALEELAAIEPRLASVVELRFFGGLAHAEIAEALALSLRTVERDWERARSFLYLALGAGGLDGPGADALA